MNSKSLNNKKFSLIQEDRINTIIKLNLKIILS